MKKDTNISLQYDLIFADSWRQSFADTYEYVSANWWPNSVSKFYKELTNKFDLLPYRPEMYPIYHVEERYRFFQIWGFLVLYEFVEELETIRVSRIIHSARNINELSGEGK